MKAKLLIIGLLICILSVNFIYGAAFEDIGSVRARGMGDSFESVSAGIDSIYYNPAGTAYMKTLQFFSEYGKPAVFFDDESSFNNLHFGALVPFSTKPYLIWLNYLVKGLTIGNDRMVMRDGSFSFLFHTFFVSDFYHERLFTFNIGKSLNNLLEGANIAVGANFKIYNAGYEMTEDMALHPDSPTESTTGFGMDFGLTYDFSKFIRLSFVLGNIIEPNISYFKASDNGVENVNSSVKGAMAWRFGDVVFMQDLLGTLGMESISADSLEGRPERPGDTIYKTGVEFWQWQRRIGFRMGFKTLLNTFTTGVSYKHKFKNMHAIKVDYALNYMMNIGSVKNYWSASYEFDFYDYYFDYRTEDDLTEQNRSIKENFEKGMVIVKYKTLPNDNLYNISLIHYGTPGQTDLLMKHNKIEDEKADLPQEMEVPYRADSFILYDIRHGDSINRISTRLYGTSEKIEKIQRFNEMPFSKLRIGRTLIIPMSKDEMKQYNRRKADWESEAKTVDAPKVEEKEKVEEKKDAKVEEKPKKDK